MLSESILQSTGSNDIIGEIISAATSEIMEGLYKLLCGEKITTYIDTSVIYPEVQSNLYSIYSFLLVAGYLKVVSVYPQHDGNFMCDVAIPNKEISFVYEKEVLNKTNQNSVSVSINQAIFSGDAKKAAGSAGRFYAEEYFLYGWSQRGILSWYDVGFMRSPWKSVSGQIQP